MSSNERERESNQEQTTPNRLIIYFVDYDTTKCYYSLFNFVINTQYCSAGIYTIKMSFAKIFKRNKPREETVGPSVIGKPTNVNHDIHVSKNKTTGQLEGLPAAWLRQIGNLITEDEQTRDPTAVFMAVKYYNYSIKKKEEGDVFKQIMTEDDIIEESKEIDDYMHSKDAHQSKNLLDDEEIDRHLNLPVVEFPSFSSR